MLNIITEPNPILHNRSSEIDRTFLLLPETKQLIKDMLETMRAVDGVGLAAPQIGKNIRLCVISKTADPSLSADFVLVNPIWEKTSRKKITDTEGCLSVPHTTGKVRRWKNIHVTALNANGNPLSFSASDLFARVVQHEVDHLDGILITDRTEHLVILNEPEPKRG